MENEELIVHQPTMINEHTGNVSSNMDEINKYFKNYYNK